MGINLWFPWCLTLLLVCNITKNVSAISTSTTIMCIQSERQALLEFKHGLLSDFGQLSSWGSEPEKKDCCNWLGVSCNNQTSNVVELNLSLLSLRGPISTSLVELHGLTVLDLSRNNLVGEIPNQLGNLHTLRALYLFKNNLVGEIPNQLGNLHALKALDLSSNYLVGEIPNQLGNLSTLLVLDLGFNHALSSTKLEWLSSLSNLIYIDLTGTNLTTDFDWLQVINTLPSLMSLSLFDCSLQNVLFPSTLSHFNSSKTLREIFLGQNNLKSSIFNWLFNHSNTLSVVELGRNQLDGELPDFFGNMISLEFLLLIENQLQGGIPKSFANMSILDFLDLSNNNLTEIIGFPHWSIGNISTLTCLDLSQNFLQGTLFESHMSNLSSLEELYLSHNNLLIINISSNWIPPFQLESLDLSHCKVGPSFPNWLQRQFHLTELDISNVGIRNSVPSWFWEELTPQLLYLNMSGNQMWGTISSLAFHFVSHPKPIVTLDLSSNHFEGQVPAFHANSTYIDLSNNQFSGPLSTLCLIEFPKLEMLDFSNNFLSGEIHGRETSFPNLVMLNLANNSFFGKFPIIVGSSCQLESLHLENNNFTGVLPWQLKNCEKLQVMDLRMNKFLGKILAWIGENLLNLVILSLQANNFGGSIPIHLCNLIKLQILDLSSNSFSGSIPTCFSNFTAMAHSRSSNLTITINTKTRVGRYDGSYIMYPKNDYAELALKREEFLYKNTLGLVKSIDLSSNKLSGKIPKEITLLVGLISLNLSTNYLTGRIPSQIGQMQQLESLDLSRNKLHGSIPTSLSLLNFLSCLDLGNNNLSGRIPRSAHLDTIEASAYEGNKGLCGPPLTRDCPGDEVAESPSDANSNGDAEAQEEKSEIINMGFYVSMGFGFMFGFWGVFGTLLVKDSWRNACAMFLISLKNKIHVALVVSMATWKKPIQVQRVELQQSTA